MQVAGISVGGKADQKVENRFVKLEIFYVKGLKTYRFFIFVNISMAFNQNHKVHVRNTYVLQKNVFLVL